MYPRDAMHIYNIKNPQTYITFGDYFLNLYFKTI